MPAAKSRVTKRERRWASVEEAEPVDPGFEESSDRRDIVLGALGALSPIHRQALVMKYLDGYSVEEIAVALKRSRVQVQSILQRARVALRRRLDEAE